MRQIVAALTPTYVFVRQEHLAELRLLERMEVSKHPPFSIFRHFGATVFVPHRGLHDLRQREQDTYRASLPATGKKAGAKPRGTPFSVGDIVTHSGGPLAGLPCYVERSDGRSTVLRLQLFGRETGVTIDTCMLRRDGVATHSSAA